MGISLADCLWLCYISHFSPCLSSKMSVCTSIGGLGCCLGDSGSNVCGRAFEQRAGGAGILFKNAGEKVEENKRARNWLIASAWAGAHHRRRRRRRREGGEEKKNPLMWQVLLTWTFEIKWKKVAIRQMCKPGLCAVINHDCVNYTLFFPIMRTKKRQTAEENIEDEGSYAKWHSAALQ